MAEYDVRAGGSSLDDATFCANWRGSALTPLSAGGQTQFGWVSGLLPCTQYRIALKARDATENWSPISNEAVVTTMCGGGGGGFNARPGTPLVSADADAGTDATSTLLSDAVNDGAEPLGRAPLAAAAWAVEMTLAEDAPVWSIYALSGEEAESLFAADSAGIVVQNPPDKGQRITRARLFPGAASTRFALRRLHRPGRLVFRGQYEFRQAWGKVATGTPAEIYEVTSARHSRLGDQTAAMGTTGVTTMELAQGDTLTLAYVRSQSTVDEAADWFMLIGEAGTVAPTVGNRPTLRPTAPSLPAEFALHANQPNPFARVTMLRFALPRGERVRLEVFDLLGRRVRTLADGPFEAGEHSAPWDGRDGYGAPLPAGVYHARIQAGEFRAHRTMVLLPSAR